MLLAPIIIPMMSSGGAGLSPKEAGILALVMLIGISIGFIHGLVSNWADGRLPSALFGSAIGFATVTIMCMLIKLVIIASGLFV